MGTPPCTGHRASTEAVSPSGHAASVCNGEGSVLERAGGALLERPGPARHVERLLDGGVAVVMAKSGSGKSTFMAQLVQRLRADARFEVLHCVFVGCAEGSTSIARVLAELCRAFCADLRRHGLAAPDAIPDDVLGMSGLLASAMDSLVRSGRRVLLCVDALNELEGAPARALGWLPHTSRAAILLTTICGAADAPDATVREVQAALWRRFSIDETSPRALVLPDLAPEEQSALLARFCGRPLRAGAMAGLGEKADRASPLYLRLLAPHVAGLRDFPGRIPAAYDRLLEALEQRHRAAGAVLSAVFCADGGMFGAQLRELLPPSAAAPALADLAAFVRATPVPDEPALSYVGFVHMQARDAVRRRWLPGLAELRASHARCAAYFAAQYRELQRKPRSGVVWRQVLARLPAHLLGANDESAARDLLCTADFCALKCRAGMVSELVADFAAAHRRWGGAVWEDFHEALQGNAHLLRAHPECFVQQFANARDSSAAARSVADLVAADRAGTALVQWRNKPQHRPICVATFRCPGVEYWAVSASPSGARLAVGASDKCVHILDRDGNEVGLLVGHGSDVCTVAFHPFAEDVVLSAAASEVFVFDVSTGSKLAAHRATGFVRDARWRGDGARVALADAGRCAVLSCDAQTRALRPVAAFPPECGAGEDPGTRACAFSPDGSRVAAVGYESGLWVYGEGTAARGLGRGGHAAGLTCVDWGRGADGDGVLATASDDGVVCVWQGSPEACARTLCVHEGPVSWVRLGHTAASVLSCSDDRTARHTPLAEGAGPVVLRGHGAGVRQGHPLDDGLCVTASDDGTLRVWDLRRAAGHVEPPGGGRAVTAAVWLRRGDPAVRVAVFADAAGRLTCVDASLTSALWTVALPEASGPCSAITALSGRGGGTALAATHRRVYLVAAEDGALLRRFEFPDWANACALGTGVAVVAGDAAEVWVWALEGGALPGQRLAPPDAAPGGAVLALALSPDERALAGGGNDGRVHVWRGLESAAHVGSDPLDGQVIALAWVGEGAGPLLVAGTAGGRGGVHLLHCSAEAMEPVARAALGCSVAWCGVTSDHLLVTAAASQLVHVWGIAGEAAPLRPAKPGGCALRLRALFPASAGFGSADGVGGQGCVWGRELCIGDEAGRLYALHVSGAGASGDAPGAREAGGNRGDGRDRRGRAPHRPQAGPRPVPEPVQRSSPGGSPVAPPPAQGKGGGRSGKRGGRGKGTTGRGRR